MEIFGKLEQLPLDRRRLLVGMGIVAVTSIGVGAVLGEAVGAERGRKQAADEEAERLKREVALTPGEGDAKDHIVIHWLPKSVTQWNPLVTKYALQYEIDPNLVAIILALESEGDPQAVSSKGAKGLMQVTEPTAKDIMTRRLLLSPRGSYDLNDPETSIEFGTAYLGNLINTFTDPSQGPTWDETVISVAASYNGGSQAGKVYQDRKLDGLKEYSMETFTYAYTALEMWQMRDKEMPKSYRDRLSGTTL